ncbi:MAG TPA: hypothetical protein VHK27_03760 [Gammaproteobacteria bacterium]|nr:hypothetical protein [Gammaproteobacteria bacterium]
MSGNPSFVGQLDGAAAPAQANDMTGDQLPPLSHFELAAAELRSLGITVTCLPSEYRVNFRAGTDATARTVETLGQALEFGRTMTAEAPNRIPETTCDAAGIHPRHCKRDYIEQYNAPRSGA